MFIEKQLQGKSVKIYLAHSYRENNKVKKIRKFLGKNISESEIIRRRKIAEVLILKEINEFNIKHFDLNSVLTKELTEFTKENTDKNHFSIKHLSEKDWDKFSESFVYNTNAIEGSELTKKEVKSILTENTWPNKSKNDIAETYGVNDAIKHIRETKDHLSIPLIKKLHQIIFKNSKDFAGQFRKKGQEVAIKDRSGEIVDYGAPQSKINHLLKELIGWYNKNKTKHSPLILASIIHHQFESVHPFADGNGRIGRLLLNNILIKHKYRPINIERETKTEYYKTIQKYKEKGEIKPLIKLILKSWKSEK